MQALVKKGLIVYHSMRDRRYFLVLSLASKINSSQKEKKIVSRKSQMCCIENKVFNKI